MKRALLLLLLFALCSCWLEKAASDSAKLLAKGSVEVSKLSASNNVLEIEASQENRVHLLNQISRDVNNHTGESVEDNTCPPWFLPETDSNGSTLDCHCSQYKTEVVKCVEEFQESSVLIGYCMTYDSLRETTVVGACIYSYNAIGVEGLWVQLPQNVSELNSSLCGSLNREGLLCGQCKPGFGVSVYSPALDCVDCREHRHGWAWYIFSVFVLQTILFVIVITFRINATSPYLNVFILFSHILLATRVDLLLPTVTSISPKSEIAAKIVLAFYQIWNLDLFIAFLPPSCLHDNITTLNVVALQYASAFYPLFLIGITYLCIELHDHNFKLLVWIWKPFHKFFVRFKRYWDLHNSVIHAFATFLLLSYTKITLVSFTFLRYTQPCNASGHTVGPRVWYQDASVELFGRSHAPYGVTAIVILSTYVLFPPVLLVLYPFQAFQKLLHKCRLNCLALRTFMDAFQGCFKDGTNGTRDYRYTAAFYFLLRLCFLSIYFLNYYWPLIAVVIFVSAALLVATLKPYKKGFFNILDMLVLALLALLFYLYVIVIVIGSLTGHTLKPAVIVGCLLVCLPLSYFTLLVVCIMAKSTRIVQKGLNLFPNCKALSSLRSSIQQGRPTDICELTDSELPHRLVHPTAYERFEDSIWQFSSHSNTAIS